MMRERLVRNSENVAQGRDPGCLQVFRRRKRKRSKYGAADQTTFRSELHKGDYYPTEV